MRLWDRLRSTKLRVKVNPQAAEGRFAVGEVVTQNGVRYRITRQRWIPTTPWATIELWGRKV